MSTPPSVLRLARWPRRLWPGAATGQTPPAPSPDPFRTAGQVLHDARDAKGLRLRDLAQRTRISIAVLEALEGGWKDRLPEATYLRTMLPLLEHELDLPAGSLEAVLPAASRQARDRPARQGLSEAVFSPFTIHFLTRWQGTALYALLTLGLLYALNLQQQRLAAPGHWATSPIPLVVSGPGESATPGRTGPDRRPAMNHPEGLSPLSAELQPLSRAAAGQAMGLLARESQRGGVDMSLGVLRMTLEQPTRVDLRSPRGGDWRLERLQGEISLPVLPPFQLRLSPPPGPAAVRWRGKPLPATKPTRSSPASSSAAGPSALGSPSSEQGASGVYAVAPVGAPRPGAAAPTP